MAKPKRRTAKEQYYFSVPKSDETASMLDQMPVPVRIANDPQRKALWTLICADMEKRRCLSPTYAPMIGELIEVMDMMHKCRESIDKEGMVVDIYDGDGNYHGQKPNPYVNILSRQQPVFLKLCEKMGLAPRDILFLEAPEDKPPEVIDAEFKRVTYFRDERKLLR